MHVQLDLGRLTTALDFIPVQASQGVSTSFGLPVLLCMWPACSALVIMQQQITTVVLTDVPCYHLHLHCLQKC